MAEGARLAGRSPYSVAADLDTRLQDLSAEAYNDAGSAQPAEANSALQQSP